MKLGLIFRSLPALLSLGLFLGGLTPFGEGAVSAAGGPVLGGPCTYKSYPGRATITSIQPVRPPGETAAVFEIRHSFQPEGKIEEPFADTEGRTFLLTMKNGTYPNQKFLNKYRIERGRVFECTLQVITRGTCTPVLFEFPGIDRGDYGTRE